MQKEETVNKRKPIKLVIFIFTVIFIIIVASLLFYFNIGGISNYTLKYVSNIPILKGLIQVKPATNYAEELKNLTKELNAKQKELESAQASLNEKQKQLESLELQLQSQQNDLNNLKLQMKSQKTDLKTLATYYESMDPQNAANILNQITDDNILIGILNNMNKDNASKILEQLDPKKAADITKILYKNASTMP